MTSEWDNVQALMGSLATIKDPDLYRTGLEYISNIISDIHDFDHKNNQIVAKFISRQYSYKRLRKLLKDAKARRSEKVNNNE
jgi:hypothetical protein